MRSLDAIHLAAALSLGTEIHAVVTYDARMISTAHGLGLPRRRLAEPSDLLGRLYCSALPAGLVIWGDALIDASGDARCMA